MSVRPQWLDFGESGGNMRNLLRLAMIVGAALIAVNVTGCAETIAAFKGDICTTTLCPDLDGDGYYDDGCITGEGIWRDDSHNVCDGLSWADAYFTEGYVVADGTVGLQAPDDCDDNNPDMHPDATEICDDGIDSDCDDWGRDTNPADGVPDGDDTTWDWRTRKDGPACTP